MGREENKFYLMVRRGDSSVEPGLGVLYDTNYITNYEDYIIWTIFYLYIFTYRYGPYRMVPTTRSILNNAYYAVYNLIHMQAIFLEREEHVTTSNNSTLQRVLSERPSSAKRSKKDSPKGRDIHTLVLF